MANENKEPVYRYKVKDSEGKMLRQFKNEGNAYKYFNELKSENPFQYVELTDAATDEILEKFGFKRVMPIKEKKEVTEKRERNPRFDPQVMFDFSNTKNSTKFDYKNGRLIRKEINGVSRRTMNGIFQEFIDKIKINRETK